MQRSLIIALLIMLLTVILTLQNSGPVTLTLLFWTVNMPIAVLILIAVVLGALIGTLFTVPAIRRKDQKIREMKKNDSSAEKISVKESPLS